MELNHAANTYGNSSQWTSAVNTGTGASIAFQQSSIPRTGQINGFGNLSQLGQQQIAARGATADLSDAITTSSMQTLGSIRTNSVQRQTDINALMKATQSADPAQHTEMATLQRINLALLLLLQEQQEANQISQANTLQQIVGQKMEQDNLKSLFQLGNGYQQRCNATTNKRRNEVGIPLLSARRGDHGFPHSNKERMRQRDRNGRPISRLTRVAYGAGTRHDYAGLVRCSRSTRLGTRWAWL
jgi:uncharacterized protein (DUF4415 family)